VRCYADIFFDCLPLPRRVTAPRDTRDVRQRFSVFLLFALAPGITLDVFQQSSYFAQAGAPRHAHDIDIPHWSVVIAMLDAMSISIFFSPTRRERLVHAIPFRCSAARVCQSDTMATTGLIRRNRMAQPCRARCA